ncbi:MAG TPA: serine hydrolase [Bacteroidia bacterium]|nr:serine hydrolase [Bacteroidia bacterium]
MRKFLCLILLTSLTTFQTFSQDNFIKDSLDSYINREMQKWQIPGVAIAIVKDGKVLAMKGYGVREIGKPDKVDEFTLFQIASNTKAFTGTALALLAYQKRISLDDKVTKYLPWFQLKDPCATNMVTIKDILCHRIGFYTFQSDFLNWDCNMTTDALIKNMRNVQPVNEFRDKYGYCNMGYVTAGEVIKAVTDTSWQDFFDYHFFKPLQMNRSSVYHQKIVTDVNAAKPYTLVDNKIVLLDYANIDNIGACASINSCVNDISHWIMMQLNKGKYENKEVIPSAVINTTQNSYMIVRESGSARMPYNHFQNYGLGWKSEDMYGYKIVSHDGGANGFVTNTTLLPELNAGFVILTNTDANWFYGALRQQLINYFAKQAYTNVSENYFGIYSKNNITESEEIENLKKQANAEVHLSVADAALVGKYFNEVYGEIEIKIEKSGLMMYFSHHPKLRGALKPLSEKSLLCTFNDPTYGIHPFPIEVVNGKVNNITVKVNDFIDYQYYKFTKQNN